MNKKLALIILSILFSAKMSYSQTNNAKIDSLLHEIKYSSGDELLKNYNNLHNVLYELNDADLHLKYNKQFIEAARAAKNKEREYFAHALKIEAIFNHRLPDEVFFKEAKETLEILRGDPIAEKYYFNIATFIAEKYVLSGNYDEALRFANTIYGEAKAGGNEAGIAAALQSMGAAYDGLQQYDKAEKAFKETINIKGDIEAGVRSDAFNSVINILLGQDRNEEALEMCIKYETFLKQFDNHPDNAIGIFDNLWFKNKLAFASTYSRLKQYAKGEEYLLQAEQYSIAETNIGIFWIEVARLAIYSAQDKYAEAIKSLDRMDATYGTDPGYTTRLSILEARADIYYEWGKYEQAANIYKDYIVLKDSLQLEEINAQLNTLRTQFDVDKLEMQKEQQQRIFDYTIAFFISVFVLFCIIIGIVISNARKIKVKNRSLLSRIQEQAELENKYELICREYQQNNVTQTTKNADEENTGSIYVRLNELMKDSNIFTSPDINRKVLAKYLGTNEKYVFDTIKEYYGTNISDYINKLRLNYAKNILMLPNDERTIEAIALESGFNSRSAFYRLFKEHYGMTPLEFRQLVVTS